MTLIEDMEYPRNCRYCRMRIDGAEPDGKPYCAADAFHGYVTDDAGAERPDFCPLMKVVWRDLFAKYASDNIRDAMFAYMERRKYHGDGQQPAQTEGQHEQHEHEPASDKDVAAADPGLDG